MKSFTVHQNNSSDITISGDSLPEAIENKFDLIAKDNRIGNIAGYSLDRIWMEYRPDILGGKGGVELKIMAHGSDGLVGYDPTNDEPKTTTVWIYADEADCPQRYDFPIKKDGRELRSPFDDSWITTNSTALGVYLALANRLVEKYGRVKGGYDVSSLLDNKFPNSTLRDTAQVARYFDFARQRLSRAKIRTTQEATRLIGRIDELQNRLISGGQISRDIQSYLAESATQLYFYRVDTVTALAYYRTNLGLTQKELADKIGITLRQMQNYESPMSSLGDAKYAVVERIADILGVPTSSLVKSGIAVYLTPDGKLAE